jgi:hypothetical protein
MLQNLIDILAAPRAVFARLKDKPSIALPLLLVTLAMVSFQLGYIYLTDFNYLIDQLVEQAMANNPNARESELREGLGSLSPAILAVSGTVGMLIGVPLISALYAWYLSFIAKFGLQEYGFRHWLSLVSWTGIPTLFVALAAWVVILSSANGQVPQAALQPLSIDALLGLDPHNAMLQNLSLPQLWSLGLCVLGYQHFTGKSLTHSAIVTLAPYVLIFGTWALISAL